MSKRQVQVVGGSDARYVDGFPDRRLKVLIFAAGIAGATLTGLLTRRKR